jgi:hypothetical protein
MTNNKAFVAALRINRMGGNESLCYYEVVDFRAHTLRDLLEKKDER